MLRERARLLVAAGNVNFHVGRHGEAWEARDRARVLVQWGLSVGGAGSCWVERRLWCGWGRRKIELVQTRPSEIGVLLRRQ